MTTKVVLKAVQVLRRRVRFREAGFVLPPGHTVNAKADTAAVKKAVKVYVESWIVPILDAIESGDTTQLRRMVSYERGEPIGELVDETQIRIRVQSTDREKVERYLPGNYRVESVGERDMIVAGHDDHGWTAEGYVIPRLGSGLISAEVVK